jgi:shikimate dehydrogenase
VTRLEVWGDPIAHSLSPALHTAAYRELGWDWDYGRRRVDETSFANELASLGADHRGLSLTMPLKYVAAAAADELDDRARLTGGANTLLRDGERLRGFNTDVGGIVAALHEQGVSSVSAARIVGAGATATSALVALAEMGAKHVDVVARRPPAVEALARLGERLGVTVGGGPFDATDRAPVDATIATLPGDATVPTEDADRLAAAGGPLLDVVYGHWPTALSLAWDRAGVPAQGGTAMLLHQAVLQIRIFRGGDPGRPLPREEAVVAVMRDALMGG